MTWKSWNPSQHRMLPNSRFSIYLPSGPVGFLCILSDSLPSSFGRKAAASVDLSFQDSTVLDTHQIDICDAALQFQMRGVNYHDDLVTGDRSALQKLFRRSRDRRIDKRPDLPNCFPCRGYPVHFIGSKSSRGSRKVGGVYLGMGWGFSGSLTLYNQ